MAVVMFDGAATLPDNVDDLDSYCKWAASSDFPKRGRVSFIHGKVWMDFEMEDLILHNLVKLEIAAVLHSMTRKGQNGYTFTDGAFLRNAIVGLATEPDASFVSFESIQEGRAELVENKGEGLMIVQGVPDMVLEVVSRSSVKKDTVELREQYWEAGIPEYWLVDTRREPVKFDILKLGDKGYVATRKIGEWLKSGVFGCSFRIVQEIDKLGNPQFTLETNK